MKSHMDGFPLPFSFGVRHAQSLCSPIVCATYCRFAVCLRLCICTFAARNLIALVECCDTSSSTVLRCWLARLQLHQLPSITARRWLRCIIIAQHILVLLAIQPAIHHHMDPIQSWHQSRSETVACRLTLGMQPYQRCKLAYLSLYKLKLVL